MYFEPTGLWEGRELDFFLKEVNITRTYYVKKFHIGFEFTDIRNPLFFLFRKEENIIFLLCKRRRMA